MAGKRKGTAAPATGSTTNTTTSTATRTATGAATSKATVFALLSAALYGISVPLSKVLLEGVTSNWLSALVYLGAGIACAIAIGVRIATGTQTEEASLAKSDVPTVVLMLAVNTASIICLTHGIRLTVAANASLLVNFEIVATAAFAWLLFRENIGRRLGVAIALICASSILLTWEGAGSLTFTPGSLLIVAACALWGLENCCTKSLSAKDPLQVTCVKGFGTAVVAGVIALATDGLPAASPGFLAGSLAVGSVSYGASIALYIAAQRTLGAARTGNYYAVAPFVGVALSWIAYGISPDPVFFAALVLMVTGTWLTLSEHHEHEHVHQQVTHEHVHDHLDGHHTHDHPGFDPSLKHSHVHTHEPMKNSHEHTPDLHHAHGHNHA